MGEGLKNRETIAKGICNRMSRREDINRIYNEFLNSKKYLVDSMSLVRDWQREGFISFEDALAFHLDTPDHYIEVIGVRHPIQGLRGIAALLLYFCVVENIEGVTFEECRDFIRELFIISPLKANTTEAEGLRFLREEMGFADARFATEDEHDSLKVDIVIPGVMGVKVKPRSHKSKFAKEPDHVSFMRDRAGWEKFVKEKGLPVFALYYHGVDPFIEHDLEELSR